jgi:hypothetical protein
MKTIYKTITQYNKGQKGEDKAICNILKREITKALPKATSKVWHGGPVWFLDENPIVGYNKLKKGVTVLFWSGQSFDEEGLSDEGSFKAAQVVYAKKIDIRVALLRRFLRKAKAIQWDYKNIVKRRGKLVRLK